MYEQQHHQQQKSTCSSDILLNPSSSDYGADPLLWLFSITCINVSYLAKGNSSNQRLAKGLHINSERAEFSFHLPALI